MFSTRRTLRIEWGDCDPAGIVFYPRYFAMFDHSTVLLIEQALGMRKHKLYEHYDFAGYPSLESQARFRLPTRFGDEVEIATHDHQGRPLQLQPATPADARRRAGGGRQRDPLLGGARRQPARRPARAADARRGGREVQR